MSEEVDEAVEPRPLRLQLQELLLQDRAEVDPGGEPERERCLAGCRDVDLLGLGDHRQPAERLERALGLRLGRDVVLDVVERLDLGGPVRTALGYLEDSKAAAALGQDVHAAVVESVHELEDTRARSDLPEPVGVFEHDAELRGARKALADQLSVAVLEDVERHALGGEEDELEREQSDFGHGRTLSPDTVFCVAASVSQIAESFFRPAIQGLVPYEPGKPVEEVQRELGLARCVKLASNEGPFGPFPAALAALSRCVTELNRYPDGGAWRLRAALAERFGVAVEEVAVGAGADGLIDCLCQVVLDPGQEMVIGWPSFASYPIGAAKQGAAPVKVPLRDDRYDLDAMLDAITPNTRLVFLCLPNNPTGTTNTRAEVGAFLDRVPDHALVVVDQAYFEYIEDPEYPDAIEECFKAGRPVAVLRTFSKIYGLAGLRVGYMVAPSTVVTAVNKVKRAFDVSTAAQEAALASLDDPEELAHRRAANTAAREQLMEILGVAGLPPAQPAVANFLYAETGDDTRQLFEALLAEGVIVRPLHGFGAPTAIRITCGTADENEFFATALARAMRPPV